MAEITRKSLLRTTNTTASACQTESVVSLFILRVANISTHNEGCAKKEVLSFLPRHSVRIPFLLDPYTAHAPREARKVLKIGMNRASSAARHWLFQIAAQIADNTFRGCDQMPCWIAHVFTPTLFVSSLLGIGSCALNVLAQTPVDSGTIWSTTATTPISRPTPIWSLPKSDSNPTFLKNLTIESFGYTLAPQAPGFQFSPGYTATFFNLQGLECPRCVGGPIDRAGRFTLPPFGAKATLKLQDGRVQLTSGFAALEAWKPDGTFEPRGHSPFSSSYGDAWLSQAEAGGRIALDPGQHIWIGATGRHLSNFGPGLRDWNTFSGNATFEFWHH
jgi:hypothetical protein